MWSLAAEVAPLLFLDTFFFACLTPGTQNKVPCKKIVQEYDAVPSLTCLLISSYYFRFHRGQGGDRHTSICLHDTDSGAVVEAEKGGSERVQRKQFTWLIAGVPKSAVH